MAKGDVIAEVATISNATDMLFQPASGVEAVITSCMNVNAVVSVGLYDGSLKTYILYNNAVLPDIPFKLFIANAHYLCLRNEAGSSQVLGYSGVQVK